LPGLSFACKVLLNWGGSNGLGGDRCVTDEERSGGRTFVPEEALALDEPCDAEGDDGYGLKPEESSIPQRAAVPIHPGQKAEDDTCDDGPSEEVIELVSLLFSCGAEAWREIALGELAEAEKGQGQKEGRCEDHMSVVDPWGSAGVLAGKPGDADSGESGDAAGDCVGAVVAIGRGEDDADSAEAALEYVSHEGVVVVADGGLQCQRLEDDEVAEREDEGKEDADPPDDHTEAVVGGDDGIFWSGETRHD
jgi:hypothetical protein